MFRVVGRRLVRLAVVLFFVSLASFLLIELVPGDPATAILGTSGSPEQYERIADELGLDRPLVERYVEWISAAVQGDLGQTLVPPVNAVSTILKARLPVTLELAVVAMALALVVAVPIGILTGYQQDSPTDRAISTSTFALVAVPSFLLGLLAIFAFVLHPLAGRALLGASLLIAAAAIARSALAELSLGDRSEALLRGSGAAILAAGGVLAATVLPDLPRQGFVRLTADEGLGAHVRSMVLPVATLAVPEIVVFVRLLRTDMIATLQEDYLLSARAKGLPTRHILLRHALRPSSFSLVTIAGISMGRLMGGTVIVETIYRLPGVGTMLVDSITNNDYRLVQGGVLVVAAIYVSLNAIVDAAYPLLDPRLRRTREGHL